MKSTYIDIGNSPKAEHLLDLFLKQKGDCYYCNRKCLLPLSGQHRLKDNNATIEHIFPKCDLRRFAEGGDEVVVMACYCCNQKQNNEKIYEYYNGYKSGVILDVFSQQRKVYKMSKKAIENLNQIEAETMRFLKRLHDCRTRIEKEHNAAYGCKHTGALIRSAMDLKNELTRITQHKIMGYNIQPSK